MKFLESVMNCSICLSDIKSKVMTTTCGHSFHIGCIEAWIAEAQTCPICREVIVSVNTIVSNKRPLGPLIKRLVIGTVIAGIVVTNLVFFTIAILEAYQ